MKRLFNIVNVLNLRSVILTEVRIHIKVVMLCMTQLKIWMLNQVQHDELATKGSLS